MNGKLSMYWFERNQIIFMFLQIYQSPLTRIVFASEYMMTSSNGNIFRVTGPLCGEFTGPGEFPAQRPVTQSFDVFFDLRLNKRLSKQPEAGDFRRHRGHYDVNVMSCGPKSCNPLNPGTVQVLNPKLVINGWNTVSLIFWPLML